MFHHRPLKQKAAFLMWWENRLSQISWCSEDSGAKELFYHYMLLNPKEWSGFTASLLLCFFFPCRPLAFSNHRALSGTPLPNLSGFPSPYLFALRKFLYLAFHFFFFLIFSCNNHILNFTLRFSPITAPMLINLSFSRSIPPSSLPCIPCTSLLVCPVEGITMSLEDVLRTKLGCFLPHDFFLTASALGRAVSLCYWSSLWAAWSSGLAQGLVALSKTILPLFL